MKLSRNITSAIGTLLLVTAAGFETPGQSPGGATCSLTFTRIGCQGSPCLLFTSGNATCVGATSSSCQYTFTANLTTSLAGNLMITLGAPETVTPASFTVAAGTNVINGTLDVPCGTTSVTLNGVVDGMQFCAATLTMTLPSCSTPCSGSLTVTSPLPFGAVDLEKPGKPLLAPFTIASSCPAGSQPPFSVVFTHLDRVFAKGSTEPEDTSWFTVPRQEIGPDSAPITITGGQQTFNLQFTPNIPALPCSSPPTAAFVVPFVGKSDRDILHFSVVNADGTLGADQTVTFTGSIDPVLQIVDPMCAGISGNDFQAQFAVLDIPPGLKFETPTTVTYEFLDGQGKPLGATGPTSQSIDNMLRTLGAIVPLFDRIDAKGVIGFKFEVNDLLRIKASVPNGGHFYLLSDESQAMTLLFPARGDEGRGTTLPAGKEIQLPPGGGWYRQKTTGQERFWAVLSAEPVPVLEDMVQTGEESQTHLVIHDVDRIRKTREFLEKSAASKPDIKADSVNKRLEISEKGDVLAVSLQKR
jgi:hypothetical protein